MEDLNKVIHKIFITYNRKFYDSDNHLKDFVNIQTKPCIVNVNIPELIHNIFEDINTQKLFNCINNSLHTNIILRGILGKLNLEKNLNTKVLFING